MRRTTPAVPFRVADEAAVSVDVWRTADGEPLPSVLESWDVATNLLLERRVTVDVAAFRGSTGLDRGLVVAVRWRSDLTRVRAAASPVPLDLEIDGEVVTALQLDVPGARCGGGLEIETMIVLAEVPVSEDPLSARRPGSIVWRTRDVYALEGHGARFPTTAVDFGNLRALDPAAAWALEWSPGELDRPVRAGVRLLLNRSCEPLMTALTAPAHDPLRRAASGMLRFDTARTLLRGALQNEDFADGTTEYEPDTVGRMLQDLLATLWPGTDARTLARRWREAPHRLEAELQAKTGLMQR